MSALGVLTPRSLFTVAPELRKFFKGSETITPELVPGNDRFHKQGLRVLLSLHTLVELLHNDMALRAYAREMVNKHRMFKMDYALYEAFFPIVAGYLAERVHQPTLTAEQQGAWDALARRFCHHVRDYLDEQAR